MASRVNTRFVVILVVAVLGLFGLLILAYGIAHKSAGELARRGDELMAQGEYDLAQRAYSKAVYRDPTDPENLSKWIGSLEKITPPTETEYTDEFFGDYTNAIRQTATILRRDVDAHERYLSLRHQMLMAQYARALADRNIEDTTNVLAFFDSAPDGQPQPWERLKRYRGLAITEIAKKGGVLSEDQYEMGIDDLERAIGANPLDVESIIGLMNLRTIRVNQTVPENDTEARTGILRENLGVVDGFLAQHPDNIEMRIQRLLLRADIERRQIMADTKDEQARSEALAAAYKEYGEELDAIADSLLGGQQAQLDNDVLKLYAVLEVAINGSNELPNTRRMVDQMIGKDKDNAELYWIAGRVARDAGDPEEALGWYARIGELGPKPLSYEGLRLYEFKRRAMLSQSEIKVDEADALVGSGDRAKADAVLKQAGAYRDQFAASVNEDNLSLVLLDGKIARVDGRLEQALSLFKRYNDQTQRNDPEGLWYEGITASQLGQNGVARTALTEMIKLDKTNRRLLAMLTLAQIQVQLQDYNAAAQLYKDVLAVNPDIQPAIDGLDAVNKLLNPELNEDPVIAAIYTARQMRTGDADAPGDYAGAIQYLREQVPGFNYDPRIARELAAMLLDSNDIEGARQIIAGSIRANPDDEALKRMAQAMSSSDATDILVELIRQSDRTELEKQLSIAQVASDRGRHDLLRATLDRLNQTAPDDKRVIELTFIEALKSGELEKARSLAQRPELSQLEKLGFQARIATAEKNPQRAIDLLKQAASSGTADASIYQMLAILQRETGHTADAVQAFEQALSIRPDDQNVITEYVMTLAGAGQYEQALSTARRLQRYGASDPRFMNIWLTLESLYGGDAGREFAVRQRERMLELNPTNADNKYQLARLYITIKKWSAARQLIDQLRSQDDQLPFVELDATWYAEQGTVDNKNGLTLANEVFDRYISSLPQPVGAEPYVANAQFMLSRGRPDLAVAAADEAVKRQSKDTMLGSKLLGDLYMRINNFSDAVKAYRDVIDADADEDGSIRLRLIETLTRLDRYKEAQEVYDALPEERRQQMVTMLQAADIAAGLDEKSRAGSILDQAVAKYPKEPLVYIKRAEMLVGDESLLNDLLSDIGRALNLDASSWQAYRVRAAAYFAVGRREEALNDLKSAVRLNPNLDRSLYAVLNELLMQNGRAGEAMSVAREVVTRRADDASLMSRIGGLFASHEQWQYAAEMYGLAWAKRHAISDGAVYIDALVRVSPPDANKANEVINNLGARVGDINTSPGLLAAQALVLQARGMDEFAQQQITKAFDLSINSDADLLNWSGNLSRYFEGRPAEDQVRYLEALKRRNANAQIQDWLDLFIARRLMREDQVPQRANDILARLKGPSVNPAVRVRAYRMHGSTLFDHGQDQQAADVWTEGVGAFPDDWEMNNNLAYVLSARLGRAEDALPYGQSALDKNITRSEPYETMAGIYIKLGKYDEAQQMIETGTPYVQSIPGRVTMLITTGRLELARGDRVEARSKVNDARSVLRSAPEAYPSLESDIEAFEADLDSANG